MPDHPTVNHFSQTRVALTVHLKNTKLIQHPVRLMILINVIISRPKRTPSGTALTWICTSDSRSTLPVESSICGPSTSRAITMQKFNSRSFISHGLLQIGRAHV